jgi:hypothetical protein
MNDKPLSDWTDAELASRERAYPVDDQYGLELRAEIQRRESRKDRRLVLAGIIFAAVSAFASMIAALASLLTLLFH